MSVSNGIHVIHRNGFPFVVKYTYLFSMSTADIFIKYVYYILLRHISNISSFSYYGQVTIK